MGHEKELRGTRRTRGPEMLVTTSLGGVSMSVWLYKLRERAWEERVNRFASLRGRSLAACRVPSLFEVVVGGFFFFRISGLRP